MQDDLQRAYQAYQQALYYLPNPKVSLFVLSSQLNYLHVYSGMTQSCGMVSAYYMTDMAPWIMLRKPSHPSFEWTKVCLHCFVTSIRPIDIRPSGQQLRF